MTDKELIRRALMGSWEAQQECTKKRIALPCPFCGNKNIRISNWGMWRCWCPECLGKSDDSLRERDAIKHWNTRPAPTIGRCYYPRCFECPRADEPNCNIEEMSDEEFENFVNTVEQWSKEHPKRTRLEDFKEKYPHAMMETDGTPTICCIDLGYRQYDCDPLKENCVDCWNTPVEEGNE